MSSRWIACIAVVLSCSVARADDDGSAELAASLGHVAAAPGLDRAGNGVLAWCAGMHTSPEDGWKYTLKTALDEYKQSAYQDALFHAAQMVCAASRDPLARRAAVEIEQLWINQTGLREADAVASLAARADKDGFAADHDKLCAALPDL